MRVGFSGTREGMTPQQLLVFDEWLNSLAHPIEFHHGCCIGSDEDATRLATEYRGCYVVGHPPVNESLLSRVSLNWCDKILPAREYLVRNRIIVDVSEVFVATPSGPDQLRSGTHSTIRYARRQKKHIVIIWPDGSITKENE